MSLNRAAAYLRTAFAGPGYEDRLYEQEQTIRQWAALNGYDIVQIYSDIGSGHSEQRPGLQQMMADASRGVFRLLLVTDKARLFRDFDLLFEYDRRLHEEYKVYLLAVERKDGAP